MSVVTELPLRCPDCGEMYDDDDIPTSHACQKMCLTPRRKSDGALVVRSSQKQSFSFGNSEIRQPLHLELLNALSIAPSASSPVAQLLIHRHPPALLSSTTPASLSSFIADSERALTRPNASSCLTRLAVEARLQHLALEVHDRVSMRLGSLQEEVRRRSAEVREAEKDSERMEREKQEAEEKADKLARQVEVSVEMLASLRRELMEREEELSLKQQEIWALDRFVQDTTLREASAKIHLQSFIEELLERAERAERQLKEMHTLSHTHADVTSPGGSVAGARGASCRKACSISGTFRCCYPAYDHSGSPVTRPKAFEAHSEAESYHVICAGPQGPQTNPPSQCWTTGTHPDTEADSDSSIYSTESQEELQQHNRTYSKKDDSDLCWHVRRHGDIPDTSVICSERLRMRVWLFYVFTYLDTRTLLVAAQVCKDWRSVARHPAVWTRVTLENDRISSKFMVTISQCCSHTQTLVLHNLKPRSRNRNESKEEYLKNTRGCLEVGLEAVLKSAGQCLTSLTISHCPNILTDRSLWLVSCHCRKLKALIYRSSSDPAGQEVLWALGAGCRDISSLYVAPLQLCLQPSRFSNRCLQTIGRCWPNLRQVGVGGAGCGLQGLVSLVRNCASLCVLELNHMNEINQEVAAELCREGLRQLHTLIFRSTPVSAKAILHFNSVCLKLKRIVVQISFADYFEDSENEDAKKLFEAMVNSLQALRKRAGLSDVLLVRVESPLC